MDDRSLKVLDFYNLLEILKEFSISPLGRKRCEALRPFKDPSLIQSRLAEVLELKEILETLGDLPISGMKDIGEILGKLEVEAAVLSVQELLDIFRQMELCKGLRRFFQRLKIVKTGYLQGRVSKLSSQKALEKEILQAVNIKGEILDRATPTLLDIRQQMGKMREKAKGILEHLLRQEELQPIFQEQLITLRNGRYVLLIKSEYKHQLKGIIHDQSQSHMTFFLEPLQVVAINNEINILMAEEKEEEYRILAALSEKIRDERQNLWGDFEILGELDLLCAMAKLTIFLKGVQPILNEDGKIDMKEARNPLLALQKVSTSRNDCIGVTAVPARINTRFREGRVVPIHLRMREGIRVLIVSGANAGGKTVALKTMGLLTLMVQCGLPIPVAEGSEVGIFRNIFAVIGDEQSIGENLSTFSSHLLHVDQILGKAEPRSLILLDELGVGTHASEGCALALGFLDRFRETGASVIITTHFDRLKVYGYLHPDVENVAVEFDEETLEPKYTLSYGSSGLSNAFLVAEKLGISEKVLEMARHHQEGGGFEVTQALEALERLKTEMEKEREQFLKMNEEVRLQQQRLKELLEGIKRRRQDIFSQAEEKARKAVQNVEAELKEWIRRQKEEKSLSMLAHQNILRKEIQAIKERAFPSPQREGTFPMLSGLKVGEHVRIVSLGSRGILMGVEESLKEVEVMTEKARVRTSLSDIIRVSNGEVGDSTLRDEKGIEIPQPQPLSKRNDQESQSLLNVIGLTVEDALPRVDKFIDQALLHGLEKVYIVHGVGSGRLRKGIGKYLKGHQGVKSFTLGEGIRGGRGLTVVELR
jgi:DNA mismatch repair protein MutS2